MKNTSADLIRSYYDAFNRQDMAAFLDLLTDDVVHDVNQGARETGRARFAAFMARMNRHYRETLTEIAVMTSADVAFRFTAS